MKQLLITLLLGVVACAASAQNTQGKDLENRVAKLEQLVQVQNQNIIEIQSQLSEALAQNLSLKNALHLQPTIAEGTNPNGINFRLLSAEGNNNTSEVVLTFEAVNTTRKDTRITFGYGCADIVDEQGKTYELHTGTVGKNRGSQSATLYPDTPVEFELRIEGFGPAAYIKILDVGYNYDPYFRFQNIPIKWN